MSEGTLGLEGQMSSEGGIRTADAAVTDGELGVETSGGGLGSLQALDKETATTLVGMARAMYPHDRLPDGPYETVVAALDTKAAADEKLKTLLTEGVGFLATTTGRHPREFASLPEPEQVKALTRLEKTPFFTTVASEIVVNLYSNPEVYAYLGYEGPSVDKGGYVDRGFDDLDWIEDVPDRRDNQIVERVGTEERISTSQEA